MTNEGSDSGWRWQRIERRSGEGAATRRVDLGARARTHVEDVIGGWGGALGKELLARGLPVERVWTYLGPLGDPPPFDDHLGDSMMDQGPLFEQIESYLASSESSAIVFRDAMAEPTDRFLAHSQVPQFTFGKEVYHYLRGPHSKADIETLELTSHDLWRFDVMPG